jgi:mono/diheme cytochrome c family protein
MKLRYSILFVFIVILLAACNFTLAEDVTPPPDYKPPTPAPTMGPLYPAAAPDPVNGGVIYAENCAPCHGATGMGDGPQAAMLQSQDVTVPALGSAEFAQGKTPAAWYQMVTQGNLQKFMPPFSSLSDQQRWDVIAYAISLHVTPSQLEQGKALCGDCAKYFGDQKMMSALSESDLANLMRNGEGNVPAFGKDFSDEDALAVAVYLRSLTFAPPAAPTTAPATQTSVNAEGVTPPAEGTSQPEAESTPESIGIGTVSGSIENQTGANLPKDVKVTLRGYTHGQDMSAGAQEVFTQEGVVNADGTFAFENVGLNEGLIFLAEVAVDGMTYKSDFAIVEAGATDLGLPPITIHAASEDFNLLKIDSLQLFFDLANADAAQVFAVYTIANASDKTVVVKMGDAADVPFLAFPKGAKGLGYEATQDTAPFMEIDGGFAMPPSETSYGLIAYSSLPNGKEIAISQSALLPIGEISLLLPEGVEVEGRNLVDGGAQAMGSMNFHVYTAGGLDKGENLEFTLTGKPQDTAVNPDVTQNKNLLIGISAIGVALILAGGWMFWRDRKREEDVDDEDGDEEDEQLEDPESVMDAIIALDDLHRAGKIPDEAYQQRRGELKDALKRKA